MTRQQIANNVSINLNDAGLTYFSDQDLISSIQDGYDDVVVSSQCIIKKISVNFQQDLTYYDFRALGISDYLATVAIFNKNTNLWLRDDLSIRDFDRIRRDWEDWRFTPLHWAPLNFQYIAIVPKYSTVYGSFDLYYWAAAPALHTNDTPLIASDMQVMLENYATGDLIEQAEEFTKAQGFWQQYYKRLTQYSTRVKAINKSDLLLRV